MLKNLLGKKSWEFVPDKGAFKSTGSDDEWYNPESTLTDLTRVLASYDQLQPGEFRLNEWQKVGRKIKQVIIKTIRQETNE